MGSLNPPSVALSRLSGDARERIDAARRLGARGATLDATLPGLRPRELDRSARRGLAATLRRLELRLGGIDLPIPPEHFCEAATQDRALAATRSAIELLAECAALVETDAVIAMGLPDADEPLGRESAVAAGAIAEGLGVRLATRIGDELPAGWARRVEPARAIEDGASPLKAVSTAGEVAMVRLADADSSGRRALGEGRLDLAQLHAVIVTSAPEAALVLDPAGLADAEGAIASGLAAWSRAGEAFGAR